ncbi:hypothetical protein [Methylorubrum populi]
MTPAAEARHTSLMRLEQAAGEVFGYAEEQGPVLSRSSLLLSSSGLAIATVATALAATITYLV